MMAPKIAQEAEINIQRREAELADSNALCSEKLINEEHSVEQGILIKESVGVDNTLLPVPNSSDSMGSVDPSQYFNDYGNRLHKLSKENEGFQDRQRV